MEIELNEKVMVPIDKVEPNKWNPNKMSEENFNDLVENIKRVGWIDDIFVRPLEDGKYEIIGGEHRWRAAKVLGYKEVPCVIRAMTDKEAVAQTGRMNFIKGRPGKNDLIRYYNAVLMKGWSKEEARDAMALRDDVMWKQVLDDTRAGLPDEMKSKFDEMKDEIKTLDDLSLVLNKLFNEYGDTVKYAFMFFMYGGKMHLMVEMDNNLKKIMNKLARYCSVNEININNVLTDMLKGISE